MLKEYHLYKSSNPKKKFMVKFLNQTTNKVNTIHFGQAGADDYTITNNDAQKVRYKYVMQTIIYLIYHFLGHGV